MTRKAPVAMIILAACLAVMLTSCVGRNDSNENNQGSNLLISGLDKDIELEILNPKVEISTQFEQMVNEYMKENPHVRIKVRTVGGGSDDRADLRASFAAGKGPDIFTNGGYEEARLYREYLEDLSDQPWVQSAIGNTLNPMTMDGKIFGMPVDIEGYGFIYNKDLFKKAGIENLPKTLSELSEAAIKLKVAGITPFANAYSEKWVLGVHLLNIAFASQEDPDAFIQGLNEGSQSIQGNPRFFDLIKLLDLTIRYGNKNPLTIDYNTQVTEFAEGQAAMIQQGNWIQPLLDQIAPNMNVGILPIPINDDPKNDAIAVGVPNNWVINKHSSDEKKAEAKKFLNWMVSSKTGKQYLVEKFRLISAFDHIPTGKSGPIADDIIKYTSEHKTFTWNWYKYPPGASDEFGPAMQAYIGRQLTANQLLQELQKSWTKAMGK